jgi:hypothetical protein
VQGVERRAGPVAHERVAHVRRGAGFDEVAGEEDPFFRQPHDGIALRVPPPEPAKLHLAVAEEDRHSVREGDSRHGQTLHALDVAEQAGEATELGLEVRVAPLCDPAARVVVRDDGVGSERGSAERADGVVVREHEVPDRKVREPAQFVEPDARLGRSGTGVHGDDELGADDRPDVGVARGRIRVDPGGQLLQRRLLVDRVGARGKWLRLVHCLYIFAAWRKLRFASRASPSRSVR